MAYHTDTMQKLEIFSCSARDVIHIYEVYYYGIILIYGVFKYY